MACFRLTLGKPSRKSSRDSPPSRRPRRICARREVLKPHVDVFRPVHRGPGFDGGVRGERLTHEFAYALGARHPALERFEHDAVRGASGLVRKARDARLEFRGEIKGRGGGHGVAMVTPKEMQRTDRSKHLEEPARDAGFSRSAGTGPAPPV